MDITVLGIDLAKNMMQLHGIDANGNVVLKKSVSRSKLAQYVAKLNPCLIGMESCGGSNYWARKFESYGHRVKLMNPKFVKPYVMSNKNDAHDAAAICEAVTRPTMRFVGVKNLAQQDLQTLHRIRSQVMKARISRINQLRGLLHEYGIVIPKNVHHVNQQLPRVLEDAENELTPMARELFHHVYEQIKYYDDQVAYYDRKIEAMAKADERCQRMKAVEGIGSITATVLSSVLSDTSAFSDGRAFAAFLGLVPKQQSSGGKPTLLGISKRGDRYLRTLLIHGARSVVSRIKDKQDARSRWLQRLVETRGFNKACVALANKNARIVWAMLDKDEVYRPAV